MNTPNFELLSKYYSFNQDLDVLYQEWNNFTTLKYFTESLGKDYTGEVINKLEALLKHYDLQDKTFDLTYLILSHACSGAGHRELIIKRNRDLTNQIALAKTLLSIHNPNLELTLTSRHKGRIIDSKIENSVVSDLIKQSLIESLTYKKLPLFHFDLPFLNSIWSNGEINLDSAKEVANQKVVKESTLVRQLNTQIPLEFCFNLLPYLNGETRLKKDASTNFSDEQLAFLYDTCSILKYSRFQKTNLSIVDYNQSDYLRNALMKFVKKLKTNRNQNRYAFQIKVCL